MRVSFSSMTKGRGMALRGVALRGVALCAAFVLPGVCEYSRAQAAEVAAAPGAGAPVATAPADSPLKAIKAPPASTKQEIEMGRKAVEAVEKDPKFKLLDGSKDETAKALLAKLNEMARELGAASARPLIQYKIKVFEDPEPNAFTLPDGHIYLSRGLLDLAGSDDEIAAVLAHEIGHNARMHVTRGQNKLKPLQWIGLAAMAAMVAGGENGANIARATPYILTGIANRYSVEYEKEADQAAIDQMRRTRFNPSAMVTFMQRLSDVEARRPQIELGIYQTHPASPERVTAAYAALQRAGIAYTPRAVAGARQAVVVDGKGADGKPVPGVCAVSFGDVTLMQFAPGENAATDARTRADASAARINELLRANLKAHEIAAFSSGADAVLSARGQEIARATPADALLEKTTPLALAQKWKTNFTRMFWKEAMNGGL